MQSNFPAEKIKVKPEKIMILMFWDSESLFKKIESLYASPHFRNIRSDLYLLNSEYFLILHTKMLKNSVFRDFLGATRYFHILEYGKMLCENDAILKVGKALFKEP